MKKEIILLLAVLFMCVHFAYASSEYGSIKGKVLDQEGEAVAFANVVVNSTIDSSMVKVEFTDVSGIFQIANIPAGEYWINVSYVGLPAYHSESLEITGGEMLELPDIRMKSSSVELDEVVVTAERPILEIEPDKLVFNVDGSVNATGSDAMELLRKAPGVVIDNNDNISLMGKNGIRIYIDGKPSPLRGDDLAAFLRSLQSNDVDAIEIITNPSSKYDAEGNAGIINIRLKKDKTLGANGNLNLGYAVGEKAKYNGSLSGNYRNKKVNAFGSYSYTDGENTNIFNMYREQSGFSFDQINEMAGGSQSHNFKGGADFFLNENHTLGFMVNGYLSEYKWNSDSRTLIGMLGQSGIDSVLIAESRSLGERKNLNYNFNYRFDNRKGNVWNLDADYGLFRNEGSNYQPNYYKDATETEVLQERINTTDTPTDIDIYTFKLDHERPLLGGKLGAGAKMSYVKTDNTFNFFNLINNEKLLDYDRSNQFVYSENVNAAYVNYSKKIKKIGIQFGVRMEQTHSTGDLTSFKQTDNDNVERNYVDFFPSGGITYTLNPKNSFQFTYSRRINRPSYQDLNPFERKLDELTFQKGNPFLRPEYANSVQLTHTFNYRLNTTLGYSHTKDLITRITDISGEKSSFITWLNLAEQDNYSLSMSSPLSIKKWWSMYSNLTGYYMQNKADYGDGKLVDLNIVAFSMYSQQTFRLPQDISLEISGWYSSPSIWGGTFETRSIWNMDAGIQKKIWDGRGNLKLSVSDIFKSSGWEAVSTFGALYMEASGNWDSRRVKLNFSYMFGNTQVKNARKRKTGLEDEQKRIKTEN